MNSYLDKILESTKEKVSANKTISLIKHLDQRLETLEKQEALLRASRKEKKPG